MSAFSSLYILIHVLITADVESAQRRLCLYRLSSGTSQGSRVKTRSLAVLRLNSRLFSIIARMMKVCRSPFLLHSYCLTLVEAELRVLPVDGHRNPEPTATVIVYLKTSGVKANAKLALYNLVRNIPRGGMSTETVGKAGRFATEGNNAINENSDLVDAFNDAIPTVNNFAAAMDTEVRYISLRQFNFCSFMVTRQIHI